MWNDFFDLVFPNLCISCDQALLKGEKHLCVFCMSKLPKTNFHLEEDNDLSRKLWGRVPLRYGLAYLKFSKGSYVQNILHHIKYKEAKEAAVMLGQWYGEDLYKSGYSEKFDLIVPVPLHKKKLRKRGYNQSTCFAEGLAEGLTIEYSENILERVKEQSSQTNKGRLDRWTNVHEIYKIKEDTSIKNKKILLADDIATTGATIEVCAHELLRGGAAEVSVAVIAIAL
ncbi:MAG TPA: phosphoribosyltransferase family protein [Cytophagaceae bacterium]|jgi:ComF family protein|nr:phosphoribosyltransferase family protein [Cytophagaceae bacterium]